MKQTEEATAETEAKGHGTLRGKGERGVIQLQLLERGTQVLVVGRIDGIDTRKHHRLHFLETLDGLITRLCDMRNGIAHLHLLRILDTRDDIAHITRTQFLTGNHVHLQHTDLIGIIFHTGIEEFHEVTLTDDTVHNLEIGDNASERVEYRVEDESLQGSRLVTFGMWNTLHDGVKHLLYSLARLSGGTEDVRTVTTDQVDNLVLHLIRHSRRHVDLVDDGYNLEVMVDGHVEVRDRLRLHALCGIDHQQGTFAGSNRTRHLIGEVYMTRGINQIEDIFFTIVHILHLDGVALDSDTTLTLQVHVIKHLSLSDLNGLGEFQHPVCQRRLAMIDMRNDTEISDMIH